MRSRLEVILQVALTLSAIAMAGAVVKREFNPSASSATATSQRAQYHEEWTDTRDVGIELANPNAAAQIVEFLDIECSACALYHERALKPFLRAVAPSDYSLVVVHRPLPIHEFAVPAAHAAECAHEQQAFLPFVEAALVSQRTFGSAPWRDLASQAGVEDLAKFSSCVASAHDFPRVSNGNALAVRMGINATPTILVNGWELSIPPTFEALQKLVADLKSGKDIRDLVERR